MSPAEFPRLSKPVDVETVDRLHDLLKEVSVEIPVHLTTVQVRELLGEIRSHRNRVARVVAPLATRAARLKSDLIRLDRTLESEGAAVLDENRSMLGAKNETARKTRVKVILSDLYDLRSEIRSDLVLVEEVVSRARGIQDELRYAFEEVSRGLASVELDYRIEFSRT